MPFTFVSVVMPIFMVMAVRLISVRMVRMPTRLGRHLISMAMTLHYATPCTTWKE